MHFSEIIPTCHHEWLTWIGKLDWIKYRIRDVSVSDQEGQPKTMQGSAVSLLREVIESAPGYERYRHIIQDNLLSLIDLPAGGSDRMVQASIKLCWTDALSKALAFGPKIFYPTAEQFESMRHVEIHVPLSDYSQPYPAMTVVIPKEVRHKLAEEFQLPKADVPTWIMIYTTKTENGKNVIFAGQRCRRENIYLFQDRDRYKDLEEAINTHVGKVDGNSENGYTILSDKSPYTHLATYTIRAAFNLMLLLTHYDHVDAGPVDPAAYEKHRRKNGLTHLAAGDFRKVKLTQDIVVRQTEARKRQKSDGEPTGREMPFHWRKGHWRNQRYGIGNIQQKRILIRPVCVRIDLLDTDLSETSVNYIGK